MYETHEKLLDLVSHFCYVPRAIEKSGPWKYVPMFVPAFEDENAVDVYLGQSVNNPIDMEPEKAQMTIFYKGEVTVFNNVPADKAKVLVRIASMGSAKNSSQPSSNMEHIQKASMLIDVLDARRKASLAQFLERRKDRINTRAPYNTNEESASPLKRTESVIHKHFSGCSKYVHGEGISSFKSR